ncbi:MAG: P-II family nitrogen regulator [Acholeplasmataceae bacterium]|jgi:hypothetical protein|nr:P-II family nitrogen regulator [Acholeplasmataceae bacterium]
MEKELIIYTCLTGFAYDAMEEARKAGARGGTILHGRSSIKEDKKSILGLRLSTEKDCLLIVSLAEDKHKIMNAINAKYGLKSEARGLLFSMKVDDTLGMNFHSNIKDLTEVVV